MFGLILEGMTIRLTPALCRGARALLNWDQQKLAESAGISRSTINDFERGARQPINANLTAMLGAFEKAGVRFTEDGCICPPDTSHDA